MKNTSTGLILLDKPQERTSSSVIQQLKRTLNLEKIGHAGTLDPFATGLLIVMCGKATRLSDYLMKGKKTYTGTIRLGLTTTSDDITGEVISESNDIPKLKEVKNLIKKNFIGALEQIPPQVSAKQVNGVRAYVSARKGETVDLKPCSVTVYSFEVTQGANASEVKFEVSCSSGTYIRALARDIGAYFRCGGCLSSLRRTESGGFNINQASSIEGISTESILSWDKAFPTYPRVSISNDVLELLRKGDERVLPRISDYLSKICEDEVVLTDEKSSAPGALMRRIEGGWNRAFVC